MESPVPVVVVEWGPKVSEALGRAEAAAYVGALAAVLAVFCLAWIAVSVSYRR